MGRTVTILGAGNGGHALAFHLSSMGHEVLLFEHPDFKRNLEGIQRNDGIEAVQELKSNGKTIPSALAGFEEVARLSTDPAEAMSFSDVVFMIVPSYAQETIFGMVMPHLRDGQTIITMPGNLASLVFRRMLRELPDRPEIIFAEAPTIPYAVRLVGEGKIFMLGVKETIELAVLPSSSIGAVLEGIKGLFSARLIPMANVLQSGFSNMNMVVHVPTATLSMGLAESRGGRFQFYAEGMSESVSKVQEAIDHERMEIGRAMGLELKPFVESVNEMYGLEARNIRDFAVNTPYHNRFPDDFPRSPRERYISEDCPYILVPIHQFGDLVKKEHPVISSLITIDSVYNDEDYMSEGRTFEDLGLEGMTLQEILDTI